MYLQATEIEEDATGVIKCNNNDINEYLSLRDTVQSGILPDYLILT